ncbi:MAG: esterase [Elusimicrobia bacterium]|nr:esterase [Elusimicrobiota bacterium]
MRSLAQPRVRRLGGLEVVEFPASPEAPTIVCMHGYGADMRDLAGFALGLELKAPARWLFPNGPLELSWGGRAWFPIDEQRLNAYGRGEGAFDLSGLRPPGIDAARDAVLELVAAAELPWDRVILGGFSQGAMLAVELALASPEAPAGAFLLSGNLVDAAGLAARAPARKGLRFFQSHGTLDTVLGFSGGKRLHEALTAAGWQGTFLDFEGEHGIPREALDGLGTFLDSLL